jgi:hypothetical protein
MPDLSAIVYVSSAIHLGSEAELERLLIGARTFNATAKVTGVLLYDAGSFFQYLEGPRQGIDEVYARIKASSLHHGIIQLQNHPIERREFASWQMGFVHAPRSLILSLSQASWVATLSSIGSGGNAGSGIIMLHSFWANSTRRR